MTAQQYIEQTKDFFNGLKFFLPDNAKHLAIIVETRCVPNFGAIVRNHLHFLPKGEFGLLVVHGPENGEYIEKELEGVDNYSMMKLPHRTFGVTEYNDLLTSFNFWRVINGQRVLIFQTDSLLLRPGIEEFLKYDYVGAPWAHFRHPGGNGGLSIRNPEWMREITSKVKYNSASDGNEDCYFGKHMNERGANIAPANIAQQFSVETVFFPSPIGIHACDKYLSKNYSRMIFERALNELKQTA